MMTQHESFLTFSKFILFFYCVNAVLRMQLDLLCNIGKIPKMEFKGELDLS